MRFGLDLVVDQLGEPGPEFRVAVLAAFPHVQGGDERRLPMVALAVGGDARLVHDAGVLPARALAEGVEVELRAPLGVLGDVGGLAAIHEQRHGAAVEGEVGALGRDFPEPEALRPEAGQRVAAVVEQRGVQVVEVGRAELPEDRVGPTARPA